MSEFSKKKDGPESNDGSKVTGPVKIEWITKKYGMAQIYQSGLEYCFISRDWKQCCPMVLCKDFLQDAIQAMHHDKSVSIYGFTYNPQTCEPLYMGRTRVAIANASDKDFSAKIPALLDFLHQFEKKLHLVRTKARPTANPPKKYTSGVWVLESSNRWMVSPPMLSMYTLLLRLGFCHTSGIDYAETIKEILDGKVTPYQTQDKSQLQNARPGIDKILKYGYAKIFFREPKKNYPDVGTSAMHHNAGICAFTSGASKALVSHWHRNLDHPSQQKKKPPKPSKA